MNNLTCWEHFFCTLIGVSSHHSPECVHAWCLCGCALAMCAFARRQFTRFFSHYYFLSNLSLSLVRSCVCMVSFWYGGWVVLCVCVFLSLKFLLIFSHRLKTVFISATLVGERTGTHINTSGKMTNDCTRQEKNEHDESSFHIMQTSDIS